MRRAVPLVAILISLLAVACGTKARSHENDALALRAVMPSVAAYWADHNTYDGMTLAGLQSYDAAIKDISIVRLNKKTYCVETDKDNPHVFFDTESFELMLGSCSDPGSGKPFDSSSDDSSSSRESLDAPSSIRASIPAIEAYYQDNGSYSGMTLSKLRQIDNGLPEIKIVSAKKRTYCIEIDVKGSSAFYAGPGGEVMIGTCDDREDGEPVDSSSDDEYSSYLESLDAPTSIRVSIPAIEAYRQDNGTYSGMTLSKLRQIDYGLPRIKIVSAKKRTYCIEIDVKGSSAFTRGSMGSIESGTCPR